MLAAEHHAVVTYRNAQWARVRVRGLLHNAALGEFLSEQGLGPLTRFQTRYKEDRPVIAAVDFQQESSRPGRSGRTAPLPAVRLVYLYARS